MCLADHRNRSNQQFHAIASAHAMWTEGIVSAGDPIRFQTKSGTLTAEQREDWIELDFPSTPATQCLPSKELIDILGIEPCFFGKTKFDFLVVVDSEQILTLMQPNFDRLAKIPTRAVIVPIRRNSILSPGSLYPLRGSTKTP